MDEALDKLLAERMHIEGTMDLFRGIQAGIISVRTTVPGPLGLSPRSERDLLLPNWSNQEVRSRLESRLMNERVVFICLRCHASRYCRVARYSETDQRCSCGGLMSACAREGLAEKLAEWVADDEESTRNRMQRNAELVKERGLDAVLCLMARGVGEATATRILRTTRPNDRERLLRSIHEAEMQYARTRRFWG
jgi:ATP-dependent Lhr-like helicase